MDNSYWESEEISRCKTHIKEHMENDEVFQHSLKSFSIRRGWMFVNIVSCDSLEYEPQGKE